MPHFYFTLYIHLVKFGERPVLMTKQVMDTYLNIVHEVAYHTALGYLNCGWRIERIECKDYVFMDSPSNTWEV